MNEGLAPTIQQRAILMQDRVWYVPERPAQGEAFKFPGWHHEDWFGNDQPVSIEYCSGNGSWIIEKAMAHPEINWVAVEKKFYRVKKIWSKLKKMNLNNLMIVCGEGHNVTHTFLQDNSVADVYINFPDPWPKNTHAKHRLLKPPFVAELGRVLKPGGSLTFVTDDFPSSTAFLKIMGQQQTFQSAYPAPYYVNEMTDYGDSYFNSLWCSLGKLIYFHRFKK